MPAVIVNQFGESTGTYQAALIGMGVVLFVITLVIGVIARAILARSERKLGRGMTIDPRRPPARRRRARRSAAAPPAAGAGPKSDDRHAC